MHSPASSRRRHSVFSWLVLVLGLPTFDFSIPGHRPTTDKAWEVWSAGAPRGGF